ncbi:MAG: hypothetical protein R6V00_11340 [Candidatus Aminicenantes bacterium]
MFFVRLLDYVAIYGLVLMPIGAVVLAEHWIFPALKIPRFQAEKKKRLFNWEALGVWVGTLVICYFMPLHLYFRWLPGYLLALIPTPCSTILEKNHDSHRFCDGCLLLHHCPFWLILYYISL